VEQTAEALVLTEWKTIKGGSDPKEKASEARRQASIYASSVLGGIELKQYRYVVLVSEDRLREKIEDWPEGEIVYRHINLAVYPASPSGKKTASQAARTRNK
jgi:hypothetical protein